MPALGYVGAAIVGIASFVLALAVAGRATGQRSLARAGTSSTAPVSSSSTSRKPHCSRERRASLPRSAGEDLVAGDERDAAAAGRSSGRRADREQVEAGVVAELRAASPRHRRARCPAAIGYCTNTSSASPSATARTGCISSSSSTSHTSCCAASPTSSDAAPRCSRPAQARRVDGLGAGTQHPELELLAHLVEPVLELAHLGGEALVVQEQRAGTRARPRPPTRSSSRRARRRRGRGR